MTLYKWIFSVSLLLAGIVDAAGPITHAYLTKKFFEKHSEYTYEEQQAFMLGTLFPDIRHLVETAREETHFENVTLEDVLNEPSPFAAGMKFHTYVDEQRETFVMEQKMYQKLSGLSKDHLWTYLKFAEDEIVHDSYSWDDVCLSLQMYMPEESQMSFTEAQVVKWHKMLTMVFVNKPSKILSTFALCNQGFAGVSSEEIKDWNKTLISTTQNEIVLEYMKGMLGMFEKKMDGPTQRTD